MPGPQSIIESYVGAASAHNGHSSVGPATNALEVDLEPETVHNLFAPVHLLRRRIRVHAAGVREGLGNSGITRRLDREIVK